MNDSLLSEDLPRFENLLCFLMDKKGKPYKVVQIEPWTTNINLYKVTNIHAKESYLKTNYGFMLVRRNRLVPLPEETKGKSKELKNLSLDTLILIYGP